MPTIAKQEAPIPGFFREHVICRNIDINQFRIGASTGPMVLIRSTNADNTRAGLRVALDVWARILATWSGILDPEHGEIGVAGCWAFADALRTSFDSTNPGESEVVRFVSRCSGITWEVLP